MRNLEILDIGSEVMIGHPSFDIKGLVTGIMITDLGAVQYRVAWWNGRDRHCEWIDHGEVGIERGENSVLSVSLKP